MTSSGRAPDRVNSFFAAVLLAVPLVVWQAAPDVFQADHARDACEQVADRLGLDRADVTSEWDSITMSPHWSCVQADGNEVADLGWWVTDD